MTMIAAASRRGISGVAERLRVSPEAPLHTFERRDPALGNSLLERSVILLVQVGVSCGELGDRTVEPAAGPEVRSDRDPVTTESGRARQRASHPAPRGSRPDLDSRLLRAPTG